MKSGRRQLADRSQRVATDRRRVETGELNVGSVKPSVKFSSSFVALIVPPTFTLWRPAVYDDVGLDADVRQRAVLATRVAGWSANGSALGV